MSVEFLFALLDRCERISHTQAIIKERAHSHMMMTMAGQRAPNALLHGSVSLWALKPLCHLEECKYLRSEVLAAAVSRSSRVQRVIGCVGNIHRDREAKSRLCKFH